MKIAEIETLATENVREQATMILEDISGPDGDIQAIHLNLRGLLPDLPGDVSLGEYLEFLQKAFIYGYPKADHTVDAVIFGRDLDNACVPLFDYEVLLIKRGREGEPFYGCWALPGGFMDNGENLDDTITRELREETGLTGILLTQFGTFSDPDRDPRSRVISTAYYGEVNKARVEPKAADDAAEIGWFPVADLPEMAFDHKMIVREAMKTLVFDRRTIR